MDKTVQIVAEHAQAIIDATVGLPPQFVAKIEELCSTLVSTTAMAEGKGVKVIEVSNLSPGVTSVYDGLQAILTDGGELSFKKV